MVATIPGCGGLPATADSGSDRRTRAVEPAPSRSWPDPAQDDGHDIRIGYRADQPRVHTFGRVVPLNPPTLGVAAGHPLDRRSAAVGQPDDGGLAQAR